MSMMTSNFNVDLRQPVTRCEATWGFGSCPNELTHVIVNTKEAGYCPVCEPHALGFRAAPGSFVIMTVATFEEARADGLYTTYAVPK